MSDGGDDPGSPWLRDDWTAAPSRAFAEEPPADRGVADGRASTSGRGRPTQTARVAVVVSAAVAMVAVVAVVITRGEPTPADPDAATSNTAVVTQPTEISLETPVGTATESTDPPTESVAVAPQAAPTAPIAALVVGEVPTWSESSIAVPSPLAEMTASTEVVVKTNAGVVHRIDIPSGRVRSLDASELGRDFQVVVGGRAIVLHNAREVVILRDELPTVSTSIPDGVSIVGARQGRDDFIVVVPGDEVQFGEREWILDLDGSLRDAPAAFADLPFWSTFFLPTGDLVVDRPGGVYAIGDDGVGNRIDEGELLGVGANHYAVERCSPALECEVAVVEMASGDTMIVGDAIARLVTSDIGTRVSPDGAAVLFIANASGGAELRVAEMASANGVYVGGVDQLLWEEAWAADSSGVFTETSGVLRFTDRVTGAVTELGGEWIASGGGSGGGSGGVGGDGAGGISSVATRPVATAPADAAR